MGFTPRFHDLTIRMAGPARFLAGLLARSAPVVAGTALVPVTHPEAPPALPADPLRLVNAVPILTLSPESEAWSKIVSVHAAMASQGRWGELLAALTSADQARAAAMGGKRIAELISQGARGALTAALSRNDLAAASAEVARFAEVAAQFSDSYAAAHLAAQAHLDMGWAVRGDDTNGGLGRAQWEEFLFHTAEAEAVLEPFDPVESYSPLLAATRYLLVRGIDEGEALCRDWYEDWVDLDPTNWTAHTTHAPHLLPQWFGPLRGFDAAARDAMNRTAPDMGAAAYAMFYMAAADTLGDLPPIMDLALVLRGFEDFRAQTGCQHRANLVANILTDMTHVLTLEGPASAEKLAKVRTALRDLMTRHLREFHLPLWENGTCAIDWALRQAFADRLSDRATIMVGARGLVILPAEGPRQAR